MKRLTVLLVTALMALLFAASNAYGAEAQKINVFVDGEQVEFTVEPFIENGTTLVPFRSIFTKLGLTIGWDQATKKVTGTKEGLVIELQIESKVAIVNGEKKELTVAPKIVNNTTFIPLRFVSENAQKEVSWDGISKEVYIADTELQILHVLEKHYEYSNAKNLAGVMSTVATDSPGYDQTEEILSHSFANFDLHYEAEIELTSIDDDTGTVMTKTTTTNLADPDIGSNQIIAASSVVRRNGQWKIDTTTVYMIDYLKADLYPDGEVTISQADQDAIHAVIEQSRVNNEQEDWEAEAPLYTSDYPDLEQAIENSQELGKVFDFTIDIDAIQFIEAVEDEAVVYYEVQFTKQSGPEFTDFKSGNIYTFKKIDGKWLFADYDLLFIQFLFDPVAPIEN